MSRQEVQTSVVADDVNRASPDLPIKMVKTIFGEDLAISANVALILNALKTNNASTISYNFEIYDDAIEIPQVSTDLDDDEMPISIYVIEDSSDDEAEKFVLTEMEIHEAMTKIGTQCTGLVDDQVLGGELVITTESAQAVFRSYRTEQSTEEVQSNGGFFGSPSDEGKIVATVFGIKSSAEAQAYNLQTLLDALKKAGCTFCKLQYAGSGDSGDQWEIDHNIAQTDRWVQIVDANRAWNGQQYETRFSVKSSPIEVVLESIMQKYLEDHHRGYEDNEGGGGELEFDIRNGEIIWTGFNNTEERVNNEPVTVPPVDLTLLQKKQPSAKP